MRCLPRADSAPQAASLSACSCWTRLADVVGFSDAWRLLALSTDCTQTVQIICDCLTSWQSRIPYDLTFATATFFVTRRFSQQGLTSGSKDVVDFKAPGRVASPGRRLS